MQPLRSHVCSSRVLVFDLEKGKRTKVLTTERTLDEGLSSRLLVLGPDLHASYVNIVPAAEPETIQFTLPLQLKLKHTVKTKLNEKDSHNKCVYACVWILTSKVFRENNR